MGVERVRVKLRFGSNTRFPPGPIIGAVLGIGNSGSGSAGGGQGGLCR